MSTPFVFRAFMRSSTTNVLSPKISGICIFVPSGTKLLATMPECTVFPDAVMNGVSSVSSGELEYAVTHASRAFLANENEAGVSGRPGGVVVPSCSVRIRETATTEALATAWSAKTGFCWFMWSVYAAPPPGFVVTAAVIAKTRYIGISSIKTPPFGGILFRYILHEFGGLVKFCKVVYNINSTLKKGENYGKTFEEIFNRICPVSVG
jgi:hypothetical protein